MVQETVISMIESSCGKLLSLVILLQSTPPYSDSLSKDVRALRIEKSTRFLLTDAEGWRIKALSKWKVVDGGAIVGS